MAYGWQILLNSVDISDKVSGFSITCSLDSYCREMTLDIADASLYASLDFSQISETPEIEILTKNGTAFVSQGTFYVEKPAVIDGTHSELMTGVWGRSITAMLGEPFAPKVSKTWTERTTFLGIVEEMCDLAGFTWDASYCEIDDFVIYANTYECDGVYPIDVITELAELAGALVTPDRNGHLCIKQIEYSPTTADYTITDTDIAEISETPEWPTFGNRVSITPTGSTSGYAIDLTVADECLSADSASRTKIYAQVMDEDDAPVNGLAVSWSKNAGAAALLDYFVTNTKTTLIQAEEQEADNFYSVTVDFEPSLVVGVWAASDTAKTTNLAAAGYTIDGNTITLITKLGYCNQSLVITYESDGIAVNYLTAGAAAEDVTVTADIEGETDTGVVYIDNPCQCPPSIDLTANPTSIEIDGVSQLIVYVEESGPVTTGKYVFMSQTSATKRGKLSWTKARLGTVSIKNEQTSAQNDLDGITQCELAMYPKSVASVYRADEDGEAYGSNLYSSHNGKVVNLDAELDTGTDLLVNYVAQGAALNKFTGEELGTAKIKAWITSTREEGCEAECSISIEDNTETTDDYPDDYCPTDDEAEEDEADPGGVGEDYDPNKDADGEEADFNWCVPDSVSDNPDEAALRARFSTALEHDCDCETLCEAEFDIYETTQNYDNASGRKISSIVTEDDGYAEGTADYWEAYAARKADAIAECIAQCDTCVGVQAVAIDDDNTADTIVPGGSIVIYATGGQAPYTFSTSSLGYSFGEDGEQTVETASPSAVLYCVNGTCGEDFAVSATVTVTDNCGNSDAVTLRNTKGHWGGWHYECGSAAGTLLYHIDGDTSYNLWIYGFGSNSGDCDGTEHFDYCSASAVCNAYITADGYAQVIADAGLGMSRCGRSLTYSNYWCGRIQETEGRLSYVHGAFYVKWEC